MSYNSWSLCQLVKLKICRDYISEATDLHQSTNCRYSPGLAFWRVDNSVGTFLPVEPSFSLMGRAYELRHVMFSFLNSPKASDNSNSQAASASPGHADAVQSERPIEANSGHRFEAVASFQLVWWNRGSSCRNRLSIWRPLVSPGMVFFGDIAVQGYVLRYKYVKLFLMNLGY